jgi:PPOX class probable F420-dependent enzyme
MSVIPKNFADLLETKALAHIATIGPKGDPQNTPVWFGWDGNHVLLTLTKTAQKYHNLRRDPRLALSIVVSLGRWDQTGGKQVIVKAIPVNVTSARELVPVLRNVAVRLAHFPRMSRGSPGEVPHLSITKYYG